MPGREKAESAWKGKGGKCLEGKGLKVPEKVKVGKCLDGPGKGGKCLDGKGRKVPGRERVESAWMGRAENAWKLDTQIVFVLFLCI